MKNCVIRQVCNQPIHSKANQGQIKTKLGLMLRCKQGHRPIIGQYEIDVNIQFNSNCLKTYALCKGKLLNFQKILVCFHMGLFQEWA